MPKTITSIAVLMLFTSTVLSGCNMSAKTATSQVAATPTPPPGEIPAAWEIVNKFSVDDNVYFVGFHREEYGIKVGYGGAVSVTQDGGNTWNEANNDSHCRFGLDIVDESLAWHVGNSGHAGMYNDGGQNWQRAAAGMSIIAYLIQLRIQLAAIMLRDTDLPISEILIRVGFNDRTHFSRMFRKHTSHSPSEYREKYCWMLH